MGDVAHVWLCTTAQAGSFRDGLTMASHTEPSVRFPVGIASGHLSRDEKMWVTIGHPNLRSPSRAGVPEANMEAAIRVNDTVASHEQRASAAMEFLVAAILRDDVSEGAFEGANVRVIVIWKGAGDVLVNSHPGPIGLDHSMHEAVARALVAAGIRFSLEDLGARVVDN